MNIQGILSKHAKWLNDKPEGERANLSEAYLYGADLSEAYLYGADLSEAYLYGANLSGANLSGANLSGADLSGANLSKANLSKANLYGADLSEANLSKANLSVANLSVANLSGANLSGANLSGADLSGANLSGADLYYTILNPIITIRNRNHAIAQNHDPLIAYRTKRSKHVGSEIYEPGAWYFANAMSWCPVTECHPGLYAGTLEQIRKQYPHDDYVKVRIPAGTYIVVEKGIRCAWFEVLEDVKYGVGDE